MVSYNEYVLRVAYDAFDIVRNERERERRQKIRWKQRRRQREKERSA